MLSRCKFVEQDSFNIRQMWLYSIPLLLSSCVSSALAAASDGVSVAPAYSDVDFGIVDSWRRIFPLAGLARDEFVSELLAAPLMSP